MTSERTTELKNLLDFAAEHGIHTIEVTLLQEALVEIKRLQAELATIRLGHDEALRTIEKQAAWIACKETLASAVVSLKAGLEQAKERERQFDLIKAETCACGHSIVAHLGHGQVIGAPTPTHCSACDCGKFNPPSLTARIQELEADNARLREAICSLNPWKQPGGIGTPEMCQFCKVRSVGYVQAEHLPACIWKALQPPKEPA